MALITSLFLITVVGIMASVGRADWFENNIPEDAVLHFESVQYGLSSGLLFLGVMSFLSCLFHWKKSIVPLYSIEEEVQETIEE